MCKCPTCSYDLGEDQAWVRCSICGAVVHQKVSKKGRVKKVILHKPGYRGNGQEMSDKACPYCEVSLERGVFPNLQCPECKRVFINPEEITKDQAEELSEKFNLEADGDHHLFCLSLKGRR